MAPLNTRKQAQLAQQLQSSDVKAVQTALCCLMPIATVPNGSEERFKTELPVITAALPGIIPCLLQHAQARNSPRACRLHCLQFLMLLTARGSVVLGATLNESQVHTLVCLAAEMCAWPAADLGPRHDAQGMLTAAVQACALLLEWKPVALSTATVFFTRLLSKAFSEEQFTVSTAAILVARSVLIRLGRSFELPLREEGPYTAEVVQVVCNAASQLIEVAGWNLPCYMAALLGMQPAQVTRATTDAELQANLQGLQHTQCCLMLLQELFLKILKHAICLSDQQLQAVLGAQRGVWCSICNCSGLQPVLGDYLQGYLQAQGKRVHHQASCLLQHGWLPVNRCRMDGSVYGAEAAGCSNVEVLMCALGGFEYASSNACSKAMQGLEHTPRMCTCADIWREVLVCVQLGMPHACATASGVRALLKTGFLWGLRQNLTWWLGMCLRGGRERCPVGGTAGILSNVLAIAAWYAERFPAVRTAIAAEHLAACRAVPQQLVSAQADSSQQTSSSASSSGISTSLPRPGSSSLWAELQRVQLACSGLKEAEKPSMQAGNDAVGWETWCMDLCKLSAAQFDALPVAQLRCLLQVPPVHESMGVLQRLVGHQIEVLQAHAAGQTPPGAESFMPAAATSAATATAAGLEAGVTATAAAALCTGLDPSGYSKTDSSQVPITAPGGEVNSPATTSASLTHESVSALPIPTWSAVGSSAAAGSSAHQVVGAATAVSAVSAGPDAPACVVCGAAQWKEGGKLQLCAGCASVRYCSSACQKEHWRQGGHRQMCKALQAAAAAALQDEGAPAQATAARARAAALTAGHDVAASISLRATNT